MTVFKKEDDKWYVRYCPPGDHVTEHQISELTATLIMRALNYGKREAQKEIRLQLRNILGI